MTDTRRLIEQLAEQEQTLRDQTFLAPCVRGGKVRTRIAGLIHTFIPEPSDREGWGIFQPDHGVTARWIEVAGPDQIDGYLRLLKPIRLYLARRLSGRTWLAYPFNEADAKQRLGRCQPVPVNLVEQGGALEAIVARWDGTAFWFEALDRRADPRLAEDVRQVLKAALPPETLHLPGLTPELRIAYSLVLSETKAYRARQVARSERERLQQALNLAGGQLQDYQDRDNYWLVQWQTPDGEQHHSAIAKNDLTVISAGICLDGEDRRFDLQSLVSVIEQRPDWM